MSKHLQASQLVSHGPPWVSVILPFLSFVFFQLFHLSLMSTMHADTIHFLIQETFMNNGEKIN